MNYPLYCRSYFFIGPIHTIDAALAFLKKNLGVPFPHEIEYNQSEGYFFGNLYAPFCLVFQATKAKTGYNSRDWALLPACKRFVMQSCMYSLRVLIRGVPVEAARILHRDASAAKAKESQDLKQILLGDGVSPVSNLQISRVAVFGDLSLNKKKYSIILELLNYQSRDLLLEHGLFFGKKGSWLCLFEFKFYETTTTKYNLIWSGSTRAAQTGQSISDTTIVSSD